VKKLLFIAFFLFAACAADDYSRIKVTKVIDGDTVVLATGQHLRYIGIDAPETWVRKRGEFVYDPQLFGPEATLFNKDLVEGRYVRVEFDVEKKDRYGRLLGYCFVDDLLINEKMIKEGYAVLYTFPPNVRYVDLFVKAQKKARKNKRGLWSEHAVISHQEAQGYIGQARTVRGKIISAYDFGEIIFLNFGPDYRKDFTAVIFKSILPFFEQKGINPVYFYEGKLVEVTGMIGERKGPSIIVNSPKEIKVVDD